MSVEREMEVEGLLPSKTHKGVGNERPGHKLSPRRSSQHAVTICRKRPHPKRTYLVKGDEVSICRGCGLEPSHGSQREPGRRWSKEVSIRTVSEQDGAANQPVHKRKCNSSPGHAMARMTSKSPLPFSKRPTSCSLTAEVRGGELAVGP